MYTEVYIELNYSVYVTVLCSKYLSSPRYRERMSLPVREKLHSLIIKSTPRSSFTEHKALIKAFLDTTTIINGPTGNSKFNVCVVASGRNSRLLESVSPIRMHNWLVPSMGRTYYHGRVPTIAV
jgi:hypothetical protein